MRKLDEKAILNIMNGAGLLASGGGGAVKDGLYLLSKYKENNPNAPIEAALISVDEMEKDKYSAVIGGMGSPTKGSNQDFTLCATGSYDEICRIAANMGKEVAYTMPIEMGGFNTFVPILVTLATGNPVIDADSAGRAVPGLETLLNNVNGYDTSPVGMSDGDDNRVQIRTKDPKDAELLQSIAGLIADQQFNANAGIAGWMLNKIQIKKGIPTGTISLSEKIGEFMLQALAKKGNNDYVEDIFAGINDAGYVKAKALTKPAKIRDYSQNINNGFDVGDYFVEETDNCYHVYFQNESLVVYAVAEDGTETPIMTAPDIITMYNAKTAEPITNQDIDDLSKGGELDQIDVVLGIIKVNENWWLNEDITISVWKEYFKSIGYAGGIIKYEEALK